MSSNSERVVAERYVLRRELGRGGMGVVWEAFDPSLDRAVAIKQVLLPDHFTDSERTDALARVRREAQSAARVRHPAVITIHDVFDFEGSPWVVMELIDGGSLQDRLKARGAIDLDTAATVAEALLEAVRSADRAGVLHRDIKPGNIMMSEDGRVILTDFGIATIEGGPNITRTGAIIGSPEYMPPERLEGAPPEHRGDLWSIGVTLFAAVEGTSPFRRDTITSAIAAVISAPLPPMTRAGWLEPVISGLLERDPDRRLSADAALALLRERRAEGGGKQPGGPAPAYTGGFDTTHTGGPATTRTGPATAQPSGPNQAHTGGSPAMRPSGPHQAHSGGFGTGPVTPQPFHHAASGGYPAPGRPPTPPPGYGTGPAPGPPPPPAHPGVPVATPSGGGSGGGSGSTGKILLGFGAGMVAVLLVAVVGIVLWRNQADGNGAGPSANVSPTAEQAVTPSPTPEETAAAGPGGAQPTGEADPYGTEGEPPSYDEWATFSSQWFDVGYPQGWTVNDDNIDETLVAFQAQGGDHQVWVTGWTQEEGDDPTSAEYLEQSNAGTAWEEGTRDYEQLWLREVDSGDYPDAWNESWDAAVVAADLEHDGWPTPERRFWAYVVSLDHVDGHVFYLISVNVPRDQADDYEDLLDEVTETFVPHI
ncbi:serine/threonine-protein kinase [Nocardiopsis sp. LOL_012]|uniref:serine/threonine-protein kinase n=1 Tax=Nocardiopsis sp. LOL_012 TaxID=3345409 RepID=UPI003A89A7C0